MHMEAAEMSTKNHSPRIADLSMILVFATFFAGTQCCDGTGDSTTIDPDRAPLTEESAVATVALEGIPILVRKPGETEFTRIADLRLIEAGTTIRTVRDWLSLNVARSIQVQLSPLTELLVIGPEKRSGSDMIVLGLQAGQVRINAIACGQPVLLDTPVASVTGTQSHFTATITSKDGTPSLEVEALTRGIVLANDEGSLPLPLMGLGFVEEFDAPRLLPRSTGR